MKKTKIIAVALLFVTVVALLGSCAAKVPLPTVQEGRFDFSVTYEINGEVKTYSGVYVCKFDGVLTTFVGSSLEWEEYIENEKEVDVPIQTNEDGTVYINFGFSPAYFMGEAYDHPDPEPNLFMMYHNSTPDSLEITSEEDVIAEYGVRLIGYEYADPIENTFEEKLTFSRFMPSIN